MGSVADGTDKNFLEGANILLLQYDKKVSGTSSNKEGKFYFKNIKPGKYTISISFIGYKPYKKEIEIPFKNVVLSPIYLYQQGIKLREVEVLDSTQAVEVKEDTMEYNAGAFKTNKDASAEDLLTKMPGIVIQNGTVQAQGENVSKVTVDGREFFGSDPNAVIKNLPAEIIERIQVFDQQSDQAQFTGFDDGNTQKTINIVTRLNQREGTFGKFTAGYGNNEMYSTGGNINFFNGDRRITILAQLNNINQQNFSSEDLLGVISTSGRGFSRIGGAGRGGYFQGGGAPRGSGAPGGFFNPGGFGGNNNISNFLVNQATGLVTTKAFGVNYSDKWGGKVDITASYFFNLTNNDAQSITNRNYFLSTPLNQLYNEISSSTTQNINHRLNLRLNYQIDESNSVLFNPTFVFQKNSGLSNVNGITSSGFQNLNSSLSNFNSDLYAFNSTNNLLFRHRFNTPGRTISVMFNGTFSRNYGNNNLFATEAYFDSTTFYDTLNQFSNLNKNGFSGYTNIVYTEPLTQYGLIQFDTKLSYSQDKSNQQTYDNSLNYFSTLLDTQLSNVAKDIYRTQSLGTGYRYRKEQLMFMLNLNYNIAQLYNNQTFPGTDSFSKRFYSLLPSFMLRYEFSRNDNLRINYRASNNNPSIDQLQNVVNNSNPTQLTIGNPNLSQDYTHSIAIRYSETNGMHMRTFFALFGATFTQNFIGNNTILATKDTVISNNLLLNKGTRLTIPENLDGYINLRSFITYGLPINLLSSNLNLNLSANYTKTPGIINGLSSFSNSGSFGIGLVLSSNISDKVDFTFSSMSNYNLVSNTILNGNTNGNYFTQNTTLKFFWQFWNGFYWQNLINHQLNGSLPSTDKRNIVLWNVSLGKKFLSNNQAELLLSANDILNQNTNIQRNVTSSFYEDVRTNILGRYYMFSFIYNIRAF
jgi:hypothetical protein